LLLLFKGSQDINYWLQQLVKYTLDTHPDFMNITHALENMKNTAMHINEKSKEATSYRKLFSIQNLIIGMSNDIIEPTRKFIKEGTLYQLIKGKWKVRYFFLFNDRLICTKSSTSEKGKYSFLEKVALRQVEVSTNLKMKTKGEVTAQKKKLMENSFKIFHRQIEFIVSAPTEEEKDDWVNLLKQNIKTCQDKHAFLREERKKASNSKANRTKEYFDSLYGTGTGTESLSNFRQAFQDAKEDKFKKELFA